MKREWVYAYVLCLCIFQLLHFIEFACTEMFHTNWITLVTTYLCVCFMFGLLLPDVLILSLLLYTLPTTPKRRMNKQTPVKHIQQEYVIPKPNGSICECLCWYRTQVVMLAQFNAWLLYNLQHVRKSKWSKSASYYPREKGHDTGHPIPAAMQVMTKYLCYLVSSVLSTPSTSAYELLSEPCWKCILLPTQLLLNSWKGGILEMLDFSHDDIGATKETQNAVPIWWATEYKCVLYWWYCWIFYCTFECKI